MPQLRNGDEGLHQEHLRLGHLQQEHLQPEFLYGEALALQDQQRWFPLQH
jgi:hypothetical protein